MNESIYALAKAIDEANERLQRKLIMWKANMKRWARQLRKAQKTIARKSQ